MANIKTKRFTLKVWTDNGGNTLLAYYNSRNSHYTFSVYWVD